MSLSHPAMGGSFSYNNKTYLLAGLYSKENITIPQNLLNSIDHLIPISKNRYGDELVIPINKKKEPIIHRYLLETGQSFLTGVNIAHNDISYLNELLPYEKTSTIETTDISSIPLYEFVIVKAPIYSITVKKNKTFINFEKDWKNDFSLIIENDIWEDFFAHILQKNQIIQVRGYTESYYGPMIKITHAGQIKKLD